MPRKMGNADFVRQQIEQKYDDHIAPINRLVDEIKTEEQFVPYVAPMYGGVNARLLSVLRDPGPRTRKEGGGSGFLCMENDDATAERICNYFDDAKISAKEIILWNAYPWYINRKPTALEINEGLEPLKKLIDLLPNLKVIMIHGVDAKNSWKKFSRLHSEFLSNRRLKVIETYHTSNQAFIHKDENIRNQRHQHIEHAFKEASEHLNTN